MEILSTVVEGEMGSEALTSLTFPGGEHEGIRQMYAYEQICRSISCAIIRSSSSLGADNHSRKHLVHRKVRILCGCTMNVKGLDTLPLPTLHLHAKHRPAHDKQGTDHHSGSGKRSTNSVLL